MADSPIPLKPSAEAMKSRPLKTGAQFTLVVPRKRLVYRHWDKERYLPGEEAQLILEGEGMDGEKLELVIERSELHDGPFTAVATLQAVFEGNKATAKFTFAKVEPAGRLTRAEWKRPQAKPGEQLGMHIEAEGYEGGSVRVQVERQTADGKWETYARWSGEIEHGRFDTIFLVPAAKQGGRMADGVQHYRFRVRTSDGRELISAVATVDPAARGERQDDPADSLEALDQTHEQEAKQHQDDLAAAHEAEAQRHAADLDQHHQDLAAAHEEAIDKLHAAEAAQAESELKAKHLDELEQEKARLEEMHQRQQDDLDIEMRGEGREPYCAALEELKEKQEEELRQVRLKLSKEHEKVRQKVLDEVQKRQALERTEKLKQVMQHLEEKKKKSLADLQKRQQDEARAREALLQKRQDEEKRRHEELLKKKDEQKAAPKNAAGGKHK